MQWKNQHPLWAVVLFALALAGCESENENPGPQLVTGAIVEAEVGGPTQPNQVFIDLSSKSQTSVNRGGWDLAFYNGSEFRVKLNSSVGMLTLATEENDLSEISAEDTVGLGAQLDLDAIFGALMGPAPAWLGEAATWLDDPTGDLEGTAIAEISGTEDENLVYILNRGKGPDGEARGWQKIRVLRSGNGYTLQFAEIGASDFEEIEVTKNDDFAFTYFSVEDGAVDGEPEKNGWDFAFTTFTNIIPVSATTFIPYFYNDYVIHNVNAVQVAQVNIEGDVTYEDFELADVAGVEFASEINAIGSSWRTVAQPGSDQETDVNHDRFYVILDTDGNYFKVRFTRMLHPETGERGYPQFEYELLANE